MASITDKMMPSPQSKATENEDAVLFGSSNVLIADEFCDRVDSALMEGVASLPLMAAVKEDGCEDSREEKMLKRLRKAYFRNIDLMEIYAGRNIFSVSNRTAHFRQRVVLAILAKDKREENACVDKKDSTDSDNNVRTKMSSFPSFPTQHEIPSPEVSAELEESIKGMRMKLKEMVRRRCQRQQYCRSLERAEANSELSRQIIERSLPRTLPDAIEATVAGRKEVSTIQTRGRILVEKMDSDNREMKNDENEDDSKINLTVRKKKKLMIEEHYQAHKIVLPEAGHLMAVKDLLQN
jgi:hypothetical protein